MSLVTGKMDPVHWHMPWKVPFEAERSVSSKHCASGTVRPDRRHDHGIRRIDHCWHRFRRAERRVCHCDGNDPGPKPVSPPAFLVATACQEHAKQGAGRPCSTGAPAVGVAPAEQFRPLTALTLTAKAAREQVARRPRPWCRGFCFQVKAWLAAQRQLFWNFHPVGVEFECECP